MTDIREFMDHIIVVCLCLIGISICVGQILNNKTVDLILDGLELSLAVVVISCGLISLFY
jgi:hypothetical protein